MIDLTSLPKKWLDPSKQVSRIQSYHPKYLGFEADVQSDTEHRSERVQSTVTMALPGSVQTHIDQRSDLGWYDYAVGVLYIDMKANEDNCDLIMTHDENSFDLMLGTIVKTQCLLHSAYFNSK